MKNNPSNTTPQLDPYSDYLKKAQVAQKAQVSLRTLDHWIKQKRVPFIKIGRNVRFRWPAVEAALNRFEVHSVK